MKKIIPVIISLLIIIPIGFYSKFYRGIGANFINNHLAGTFYEIFWCLLIFLFFQKIKVVIIVIFVFLITCFLEFMQLWHPPFLEYLRGFFIGRTILGNSFNWNDFPYYVIGSLIGWFWISKLKQKF